VVDEVVGDGDGDAVAEDLGPGREVLLELTTRLALS